MAPNKKKFNDGVTAQNGYCGNFKVHYVLKRISHRQWGFYDEEEEKDNLPKDNTVFLPTR